MRRKNKKPWTCRILGCAWALRGMVVVFGEQQGDLVCTYCGTTQWSGSYKR